MVIGRWGDENESLVWYLFFDELQLSIDFICTIVLHHRKSLVLLFTHTHTLDCFFFSLKKKRNDLINDNDINNNTFWEQDRTVFWPEDSSRPIIQQLFFVIFC